MYDRIEVTKRGVFMSYTQSTIEKLNADIRHNFHHIFPIEKDFNLTHAGVSRLVMLDRYSQKDRSLKTLGVNDIVVTIELRKEITHIVVINNTNYYITIFINF